MKAYVYSDLSVKKSLVLLIEGKEYAVTQFVASWAANEIPTAACLVAIGHDARTGKPATVHTDSQYQQMVKAQVIFKPTGDYSLQADWPKSSQVIFDGFFTGFAYRKISGKAQIIANLIHWLAALGFSSALTKAGHVANPTQLNAASVLPALGLTGGGQGVYISSLVPGQVISTSVRANLWESIKSVFCGLADVDLMSPATGNACGGTGRLGKNDKATEALKRIEGPGKSKGGDCSKAYKWGVPLKLDTGGITRVDDAVANAIGFATTDGYSHATFWDKLVGEYCPMFNMAVIPLVDSAIVVADTPAYNGDFWTEISPVDYDSFDMTGDLQRPLRGVGVISTYASQSGAGERRVQDGDPIIGGCYLEDSVSPSDGAILYVAPPAWLAALQYLPVLNGPVQAGTPVPAATTPPTVPPPKDTAGTDASALYSRFAQAVYANNMLRGRGGVAGGKLRFDIAPGSIIKIQASAARLIGGEDSLAVTQLAAVQRVTVGINAESAMAGTTLALTHLRTETENKKPRTSVSSHPLFGKSIHGEGKHGAPLVDAYLL